MIQEFFSNIWAGIVQNKDVIFTIISSAEFVTLIPVIVSFFRNIKSVKSNTASITSLLEFSTKFTNLENQLTKSTENYNNLENKLLTQEKELREVKEQNSLLLSKLDAILEVQSVVYSTSIKDTSVRSSVVNILTNAKHAETNQMAKLKEKLENLQSKVVEKAKAVEEEITQAVKEADTILDVTKETVMRC